LRKQSQICAYLEDVSWEEPHTSPWNPNIKPVLRDVKSRGRDIEGCIKQWFAFVKPNFLRYVEPQRNIADIIIPRGVENIVAIDMVSDRITKTLREKSELHQQQLLKLGQVSEDAPLSENVIVLDQKSQIVGINTLLLNPTLSREDFIFYFDRIAALLIERSVLTLSLSSFLFPLTSPAALSHSSPSPP
jgi:uridine kinase